MLDPDTDPTSLAGLELVDRRGERLGRIRQIYPDGGTIGWAGVRGNLIGTTEALVPLDGAELDDGVITVPIARARFLSAPRRTPDAPMDESERDQLRRFYADRQAPVRPLAAAAPSGDDDASAAAESGAELEDAPQPEAAPQGAASVPTESDAPAEADAAPEAPAVAVPSEATQEPGSATPDEPSERNAVATEPAPASRSSVDELTRSEQRIQVDTTPVPNTRVVLRRVVVTEQKTFTVPVRREEMRLVREPIVDAEPVTGVALVDSEQVIVLHEERVVVTTEVVPIERIRLVRETLSDTREVTGQVWHEQLEASEE